MAFVVFVGNHVKWLPERLSRSGSALISCRAGSQASVEKLQQ